MWALLVAIATSSAAAAVVNETWTPFLQKAGLEALADSGCVGMGADDILMNRDLSGQVHIVTGGTSGIGLGLVKALCFG